MTPDFVETYFFNHSDKGLKFCPFLPNGRIPEHISHNFDNVKERKKFYRANPDAGLALISGEQSGILAIGVHNEAYKKFREFTILNANHRPWNISTTRFIADDFKFYLWGCTR